MSQRRMFSPDIVSSDAFLDMPTSSRELYFQLGMHADDDGFVNPKRIMRLIGASDDDLKILLLKRFLLSFESGVVVIKHWLIHNLIRSDLYKETIYKEEKKTLGLKENGSYTELREGVSELKSVEAPLWLKIRRGELRTANVPQTALRLGKVRLDTPANAVSKKMKTYNENDSSDSYEAVVDSETGLIPPKPKKQDKGKNTEALELVSLWEQKATKAIGMKPDTTKSYFIVLQAIKQHHISARDISEIYDYFLSDNRIPQDSKLALPLCLSGQYITKWKLAKKNKKITSIEASDGVRL